MSFAPAPDQRLVIGGFQHKVTGKWFEFRTLVQRTDWIPVGFDYEIYVCSRPVNDSGIRYAKILKTVAHVVIDEDADCKPVIQVWPIKDLVFYQDKIDALKAAQ
jgi:hypothetical protein